MKKNKDLINAWKKVIEDSPELQCNHCKVTFKYSHDCDYEKLKEINKELKEEIQQLLVLDIATSTEMDYLDKRIKKLQEALKLIAKETGTPYAKIAEEALKN